MNRITKVLFVDDEVNILKAIRRVMNSSGLENLQVSFASSGKEGLEKIAEDGGHIVVSDERMPGMSGTQFLEQVALSYPNMIRILLTGYSSLDSAISAINQGKVFAYLRKPIDNIELTIQIKKASEYYWLQVQNVELLAEIKEKNEVLENVNQDLEKRVKERTMLLIERNQQLMKATSQLKDSIDKLVMVVLGFLELSNSSVAQHSKRVAEHARIVAPALGLTKEESNILVNSALLHDVGKIGLPEQLAVKPFFNLSLDKEKELIKLHPEYGVSLLKSVEELRPVCVHVLYHHENFDGSGYPEGLKGNEIPFLTRVLTILNIYDILRYEKTLKHSFMGSEKFVLDFFRSNAGKFFDADIVSKILDVEVLSEAEKPDIPDILEMGIRELREGMELAENIVTVNKLLILPKGEILDDIKIRRILKFRNAYGISGDKIKVKRNPENQMMK
jgi:adenylate cyclase